MFSKHKQPPIRSLVAEGCSVHGDVVFADGIRIDGRVEGTLTGQAGASKKGTLVFVSEYGRVAGGIKADTIIVNGVVEGPIHATAMLELQPKARISGDISYRQLEMHQGALISGRMQPILPPQASVESGGQDARAGAANPALPAVAAKKGDPALPGPVEPALQALDEPASREGAGKSR